MDFKKFLKISIVFLIVMGWIVSGWPRIWQNPAIPPEIQIAKAAPDTRTKTVEYFVGQNYSTAGITSGTGATYDFTVYFPDAISSASVIRSAFIEYNTVISAVDASATLFQLGVQEQTLTTLSSPAVIDQAGESQPVQMKLGATSVLQGIIQSAGTFNLRFTTSITGPVRYGESARLFITYDYNAQATTQLKTIYTWVHSQAATVASGGTVTSANFNLGLPESTITSQSVFIETRGYVNAALTTGFYWNAESQRDIAWPNTTNSYGYVALISPTSTYSPNTNNTFTIKSVTGAFSAPLAVLVYTYSFDYSSSTELMNSLRILLFQGTETASTVTLSGNKVINIPESGITMKSSFLFGRAVNTAAMTSGMNAQLGSTPTTTGISFLANAAETDGFRTIVWNVTSNLSTMATGDNTVYWAYAASAATNIRGLVLFLSYKYNKSSTTVFNSQADWWVGQQTAASTTWPQSFTPLIADSNFTLRSSHLNAQFNTNATTATTYTAGINTTGAYAYLTTGENTMGEVWRDTSSDVTSLGSSLTATLNGSNSTTKSAAFTFWWQYQREIITVGTSGSQVANMNIPSTNQYVGGAFTFVRNMGSADVTQIIITDQGTVNANSNLSNVDIYYETAVTCTYDANETLFGTAVSFNASEKAIVTGTMPVGTSQICVYVVLVVGSGASAGQTIEIEISNPSTEVTVSAGTVSPNTAVAISETTTLQVAPIVSVSVSDGIVTYGIMPANTSTSTLPGALNDMQTATNDGNVTENFNIKGQDATGGGCVWTLTLTNGSDQYVHQFCNDTDYDCTSPPTNYTALTTSYQALDTGIPVSGTVQIQLRLTTPNPSSCFGQQSVNVTVQATN